MLLNIVNKPHHTTENLFLLENGIFCVCCIKRAQEREIFMYLTYIHIYSYNKALWCICKYLSK